MTKSALYADKGPWLDELVQIGFRERCPVANVYLHAKNNLIGL